MGVGKLLRSHPFVTRASSSFPAAFRSSVLDQRYGLCALRLAMPVWMLWTAAFAEPSSDPGDAQQQLSSHSARPCSAEEALQAVLDAFVTEGYSLECKGPAASETIQDRR